MDPKLNPIFTDEKNVFSKLQSYNQAYSNYMLCNSNDNETTQQAIKRGLCGVSGSNTILPPDMSDLNNSITSLQSDITYYTSHNNKTNQQYDASLNQLKSDYSNLLQLRSQLDLKLQDLAKNDPSSVTAMTGQTLDATIYANLLWTILATSMVYVVFTKL